MRIWSRSKKRSQAGTAGHAILETAFMLPWILFLFMGIFDIGFYSYAMIAVQNAARVAALHTSADPLLAGDSAGACTYVLDELNRMLNVGSRVTTCDALPVIVTVEDRSGVGGAFGADGRPASRVTVRYQTIPLFPLPFLPGRMNITRVVEARI